MTSAAWFIYMLVSLSTEGSGSENVFLDFFRGQLKELRITEEIFYILESSGIIKAIAYAFVQYGAEINIFALGQPAVRCDFTGAAAGAEG